MRLKLQNTVLAGTIIACAALVYAVVTSPANAQIGPLPAATSTPALNNCSLNPGTPGPGAYVQVLGTQTPTNTPTGTLTATPTGTIAATRTPHTQCAFQTATPPVPTATAISIGKTVQFSSILDTTAANTTSASLVDVDATNAIITMTTHTGGTVEVQVSMNWSNSGLNSVQTFGLSVDSGSAVASQPNFQEDVASGHVMTHWQWVVTGLSAGSHTFKPQWATNGSTLTLASGAGGLMENATEYY